MSTSGLYSEVFSARFIHTKALQLNPYHMEDVGNLKETILKRSLEEVKKGDEGVEPCVICLEPISEAATTNPCHHHNFDYLCLLNWLEQQNTCPLCKTHIASVEFTDKDGSPKTYVVPEKPELSPRNRSEHSSRGRGTSYRTGRWGPPPRLRRPTAPLNSILTKRRDVYRNQMYSLHVGSNRVSAYQDLTPERIASSPALISRARAWIRRELEVFTFLNDTPSDSRSSNELSLRNVSNAFFLLEYVIAIVKTVDIKGSSGQAEDMLADFLGRQNARLFLHELGSFLRSPYETVEAWDRHVQYPKPEDFAGRGGARDRERKRAYGSFAAPGSSSGSIRGPKRRFVDRYVPD